MRLFLGGCEMRLPSRVATTDKSCVIISSVREMVQLEVEWNALWLKAKGSFSQTYSLAFHSWNEVAAPAGRSLFCIVVREGGRLVLVFPLLRYRKGPCWMLRPLGPNAAEGTAILVDPESESQENVRLAWQAVETVSKADIIHMPFVEVGSVLDRSIRRGRNLLTDRDVAPFVDLHEFPDWEKYELAIGANTRQQLNRKRRRLSEMGDLEFVEVDPVTTPEYARELLECMFSHKKVWAERVGKRGVWITSPEYRRFLYKWISDPRNVQSMRVFAILIDRTPIAVKLASFGVSHIDLNIAGFHSDPRYAKYSPGFVLDEYWMKIAFEKHLNVDFGVGDEPYKLFWSSNARINVASYHIPQTLVGRTVTRLWRLKRIALQHMAELRERPSKAHAGS
ncbi:GNAT family N-acetyltransferase [Rhizobium sp. S152]|uniref:GNAT family N-acetyltransferase n=1 Tax=Rhizobium sp. S152 TaxID=3055038 RepID=UPI0025AA11C1|nr:GNAT family N-acetyltransferase [Rhizobium sp. S152]MDM9629041.1 GNAT family N-acetyltransferase [Rhizobium sp. S152]